MKSIKTSIKTSIYKIIVVALALSAVLPSMAKRVNLITEASQLSSNATDRSDLASLIDGEVKTFWQSDISGSIKDPHYIQVDLGEGFSLGGDDMVVYIQRQEHNNPISASDPLPQRDRNLAPITFEVQVSNTGKDGDWRPFKGKATHVYFLFRGLKTKEYSARITTDDTFRYIRFILEANISRTVTTGEVRCMRMAEFQLIQLGKDDTYSNTRSDRFRQIYDYTDFFSHYSFENTMGILDRRNHKGPEPSLKNPIGVDINNFCNWNAWDSNGYWRDTVTTNKAGVEMPDFSYITEKDTINGMAIQSGKRQRTHYIEHDLYAMPGDIIALYPFYEFEKNANYEEKFSHWYDYKTGGRMKNKDGYDLLDFLIDPGKIVRTEKHGYFAGSGLELGRKSERKVIHIKNEDEFIEFANNVNKGEEYIAFLEANLDFKGMEFTPVGTESNPFGGVFDGGGHTISNVKVKNDNANAIGIFAYVKGGTKIQNFVIDSSCSFESQRFAGAIGAVSGDLDGNLIVSGIINHGTVTTKKPEGIDDPRGQNAAGIIGCVLINIPVTISDCGVTVPINGDCESAAICGWFGTNANNEMLRCWSTAEVNGIDGTSGMYRGTVHKVEECYGNGNELNMPADYKNLLAGKGSWKLIEDMLCIEMLPADSVGYIEYEKKLRLDRKYGAIATFFYPRDPYAEGGIHPELPNEYIVAADFSQKFNKDNIVGETIVEPTIVYRHLFRIRDGKAFADTISGSLENNLKYVRDNMRHVTARAGEEFQIRLDSPVPKEGTENVVRSKYYYKISKTDYRRICSAEIRVLNTDNGQVLTTHPFRFAEEGKEPFNGYGSREIDGITYYACGGGGIYYRFIKAESVPEGRYTVQLLAKDYNGNPIHPYGAPGEPLIMQEFRMNFLPKESAFMIPMAELDKEGSKYSNYTEENLEKAFGAPTARVDFDEYRHLAEKQTNDYMLYKNTDNVERWQFKWPVPWAQSNYGFGYNAFYDYNMYRISSHSLETPYKVLASMRESDKNFGKGKGLYDRHFYRTKGAESGFFYYVNASTDPGIMAVLKINDLCSGSTLNVSAFVSEFSATDERANIAFNFVARKKDGTRVPIHSFVSGYVPKPDLINGENEKPANSKCADWFNIYYSFVPNFSGLGLTTADIDHYELELDNNCKSSSGGDYAIDDIRVYVVRPQVSANQVTPLCDSEKSTDVMITTPFDVMLQTLGYVRATSEANASSVDLFYTILDKAAYDKARSEGLDGTQAYEKAVLRYNYMDNTDSQNNAQSYGRLKFSTYFDSEMHKTYTDSWSDRKPNVIMKKKEDGKDYLCFLVNPYDTTMISGKEYLIALCTNINGEQVIVSPGASDFDIENGCSKVCTFRVQASGTIKINGVVVPDANAIMCCENQQPVVQINLKGKEIIKDGDNETEKIVDVEKNAHFDWYKGTRQDFDKEVSKDNIKLIDALTQFRLVYSDEEHANVEAPKGDFTEAMRDYLLEMTTPIDSVAPKLELYKSSYVFPPLKTEDGKDEKYEVVTAIPIDRLNAGTGAVDTIVCSEPAEVRILVRKHAPMLLHGLSIKYPSYITDVPLRVGLNQLKKVKTNTDGYSLNIPLRLSQSTQINVKSMNLLEEDKSLYLAETNDPAYKNLYPVDENTDIDSIDGKGLIPVGEMKELVAKVGENIPENILRVTFDKDFEFKESYYYKFLFHYEENLNNTDGTVDTDNIECEGNHVFTLKVAPEYAMWTAKAGNHNWNNDFNWRRVESKELNATSAGKEDFVSDGNNKAEFSYMPLDFTKVIIPRGNKYPYLYEPASTQEVSVIDGDDKFIGVWPSNPEDTQSDSPAGCPEGALDLLRVGATPDIHYDMVARQSPKGISCRSWYMHACDKIHFHSGSRIFNQQWLDYNNAWVDFEITPNRWTTLSSPLQGVLAGDMYLPKADGRQATELFKDITFSYGVNDRFAPAVFQRSWNKKGMATVYEIKDGPYRDVAVAADWSNVYNDVTEAYSAAGGFSVKADVSAMPEGARPEKVMFRLPKADTFYDYYSQDGDTIGNNTPIADREKGYVGRLNDTNGTISVSGKTAGKYFLVGNPFMTDLIMEEFLKENAGEIAPKYWILTAGSQQASIFDATDGSWTSTTLAGQSPVDYTGAGTVTPLQGFFVEALKDVDTLTLKYNEKMMSKDAKVAERPELRSRGDDAASGIRISAIADGKVMSSAVLRVLPDASMTYSSVEDVVLFSADRDAEGPVVYTLADRCAIAVNSVPELKDIEIGYVDVNEGGSVLRFENVDAAEGYVLYDTSTDRETPITEGMEYEMPAAPGARLFIKAAGDEPSLDYIQVRIDGSNVTITTTRESLSVSVFDTIGRMMKSLSAPEPEVTMSLESGVYIIDVFDGVDKKTIKIAI